MAKSKYASLIYLATAIFFLSFASCKTPAETETGSTEAASTETEETDTGDIVKTEESGISQLYLMVRLVKPKGSDVPGVIGVERSISEKQGNPLPVQGSNAGKQAFKCALIGTDGSTISTTTQNASYEYGAGKNEAILKFILPVAQEIKEAQVSYQTKAGDWEVLLVEEMKEE
ncbi:hypothetical protein G3O08_10475 [Cryomorpha ignava]|uniref:DUF4352 domain-containing protein n=1 Tax=Cryomorpha ignava TaxID=101383 RepID=A0A7K3WQI9_9FLAO|nr:hypothetical protein [Cryomorpha ignava]NEN23923.1 hypothetical protein [Cryomorpha ignava]